MVNSPCLIITLLINVKAKTIVGILTLISRIVTTSKCLKHENSFSFSFFGQLKVHAHLCVCVCVCVREREREREKERERERESEREKDNTESTV